MKKHPPIKFLSPVKRILIAAICLGIIVISYCRTSAVPTVSVVMPVFNRQDLVERAIDSILNQSYTDFEFIIVDDGSTDETPAILKDYAQKDTRIKIFTNPTNKGIAYSRQRGLDLARGKYVAIMDSDDWSLPDRLAKSVSFMADHPEIDAMTGPVESINDETSFDIKPSDTTYTLDKQDGFYEIELTFYNSFANVASLFKREFAVKNKIHYDPGFVSAEDYDFWRQFVSAGGKLASITDTLVYIRSHGSNSPSYYEQMISNSLKIHRKLLSRFFTPKESDLKFVYPLPKKCKLLKKMANINKTLNRVPQEWIEKRYTAQCPENRDDYLLFTHTEWSDFVRIETDGRVKRYGTGEQGKATIKGNQIIIEWDNWDPEIFEKKPDGSYDYKIRIKAHRSEPIISVVMSTYNRADFLPKAIESILDQTFKDWEFIIINDGSTDQTATILDEYAARDSRIKVLTNPQNRGLVWSLNLGLDNARGEFIARMDDDDISLPDRFEKQYIFLRKYPDMTATSSFVGQPKNREPWPFQQKTDSDEMKTDLFLGTVPISHPSLMIRRAFLDEHHIRYSDKYRAAEDTKFYLDLYDAGAKMGKVPEVLVLYRLHGDNPAEWYDTQYKNSNLFLEDEIFPRFNIHDKILSRPACPQFRKMVAENRKKQQLPQEILERAVELKCP